jgi:deoxyribonuclease-4
MARNTMREVGAPRRAGHALLPLIGAQLSTAGGFAPVPERAVAIGAEVAQIFSSNPRTWRPRSPLPEEVAALVAGLRHNGIPLYLHTIYLLNLASPDDELRRRSRDALATSLAGGALTLAAGVVTHLGSHRGDGFRAALPRIRETVQAAIDQARRSLAAAGRGRALPPLLLENSAGSGHTVGGDLEELSALLQALPSSCGLCLDTAHLFAAGYPVHTAVGLERLVQRLRDDGLLERVSLIHLNDSKTPFASRRDQHENPGAGHIGRRGLRRVVRHPAFAAVPFVLEVPGEDGHGPDAANVALVKLMRRGAAGPPRRPARGE